MGSLVTLHEPTRPVAERQSIPGTQDWPSSARERELAAYKLASLPFPGVVGVFYQSDRPTKNALEKKWIETTREKIGGASDVEFLRKTFDRMKWLCRRHCHPSALEGSRIHQRCTAL